MIINLPKNMQEGLGMVQVEGLRLEGKAGNVNGECLRETMV